MYHHKSRDLPEFSVGFVIKKTPQIEGSFWRHGLCIAVEGQWGELLLFRRRLVLALQQPVGSLDFNLVRLEQGNDVLHDARLGLSFAGVPLPDSTWIYAESVGELALPLAPIQGFLGGLHVRRVKIAEGLHPGFRS